MVGNATASLNKHSCTLYGVTHTLKLFTLLAHILLSGLKVHTLYAYMYNL